MFRSDRGLRFLDVTSSAGVGHIQKGHGVAFADFDNDGDQDIYQQMGGYFPADKFYNAFYENPGFGAHWITLRLQGVEANRSAIGARVRVKATEESGESRSIYVTVGHGGSFGGSSLQQEVGLGSATLVDTVEVHWPGSGRVQRFVGLEVDRVYRLIEGSPDAETVELPRFEFRRSSGEHPHQHR